MSGPTIAIVDDDDAVLEQMRELLGAAGYSIRAFRSLESAYAALHADPPSAAIVELRFPHDQHGIDLVTTLKLREATRALPVILTSADAPWLRAYEEQLRSRAVPAIWVLPKPIDGAALLRILARALGRPDQLEREAP